MRNRICYVFIAVAVLIGVSEEACESNTCLDTSGKHFLVTLPPVDRYTDCDCEIHIGSMHNGFAKLTKYTATNRNDMGNFTLKQGVLAYSFKGESLFPADQGVNISAIEVISTVDVRVYVSCEVSGVAAAFVVLPTTLYGRKYVWSSYRIYDSSRFNYLLITSIHNNTRVSINNIPQSNNINDTLNEFVTLAIKSQSDPIDTLIVSDKPVSVVSGCMCSAVPQFAGDCDTMYDAPIPVEYWGNQFIVPPLPPNSGYVVQIYTNGTNNVSLQYMNGLDNRKESFSSMKELILTNNTTVIITDRPVSVVQYGFGNGYQSAVGDSFMASVPAVNQFSKEYVFPTVFAGKGYTHRIAVTIATSEANGLSLNGRSLSTFANFAKWNVPAPFSNHTVITIDLTEDNYTLVHRSPDVRFSVLYYGLRYWEGFGYYLGFSFPLTALPSGPSSQDLMCFHCEDTSSLAFCDTVESCKSKEVCFLERYTTPEGHVHFRSGCKDKQTCSLHNQTDVVQGAACLDCCDDSFCNSQGCGDTGFPPAASRGPICLDCAHVRHPTECDQVTLCASDELCYAEEVKWGAESLFHLGCKSDHQCAFESRSAVTRTVPVCRSCCHGDFCNRNCTAPDNHQSPIFVGRK